MLKMIRSIGLACLLVVFLMVHIGVSVAQTGGSEDLTTWRFRVVFEDVGEFPAVRVTGLVSETLVDLSPESYHVQPRRELKPVHLVIVRKAVPPDDLWRWRARIMDGRKDTRGGRVDLLDENRQPVLTWEIKKAWPFKWEWPELDAQHPAVALEAIHFIAEEVGPAGNHVIPLPVLLQNIEAIQK